MKTIIIAGLPGVGKTTVLKELVSLAEAEGLRLNVVNYGTVMLELARERGISLQRDQIRKSSIELQKELQRKAAEKIRKIAEQSEVLLVDTHMIVRTGAGYLPGIPEHVLNILSPDAIMLIEASPDEIAYRREKDKSRARDKVLIEDISRELEISRNMASHCACKLGVPVFIVKNPHGKVRETAQRLLQAIKNV